MTNKIMDITKEMLFNYFSGKATTLQKRRIEEWVKKADNTELFYQYLAAWESQNLQYVTNVEEAISHHKQRLGQSTDKLTPHHTPVSSVKFTRWIAAAIVVVGFAITGYLTRDIVLYKTIATTYGETRSIVLNDGSRVAMNANSSLTYPRFGFGSYTREVSLRGEANFSVTHTANNQKFIVKTADGPNVVVLGTEFTVYTRRRGTKVVLNKGKIQLNYEENKTSKKLIMSPGELVTIDTKGKAELVKTDNPEVFSAWKDHRYVFDQTSLQDLCTLFSENFGIQVEIADPDINSWTVSGAFMASDSEELLEALAESSGLVYKKEGNKIIIQSVSNKQIP